MRSLLTGFGDTSSPLRTTCHGYSTDAMTKSVSRTCDVLISVRTRAENHFPLTELLDDVIFRCRDDAVDASGDAGRSSTALSRSLGGSCGSQDRHNWWGRERIVPGRHQLLDNTTFGSKFGKTRLASLLVTAHFCRHNLYDVSRRHLLQRITICAKPFTRRITIRGTAQRCLCEYLSYSNARTCEITNR